VKLLLRPVNLETANKFVAAHHRHNKPSRGCKFCLAAYWGNDLVGVCIVSRPVARMLDNGVTAEIVRLCVKDGAPPNACSYLYGAARRVWFAMGGLKLVTYTLQSESGASLRGAGWDEAARLRGRTGEAWTNRGNGRVDQAVVREPKIRWETAVCP
jgi:hypothetical protein